MKFISSPLLIILVASLLGVGVSCLAVWKRIPDYAALAAQVRPKPKAEAAPISDRTPSAAITNRAVNELKSAKDQLALREASLGEQAKRLEAERLELERTRAEIEAMRKQVEGYLTEAKGLNAKARSEDSVLELKNLRTLVQTYSNMSPKSAVAIMLQMEDASAVKIFSMMKADVAAGIFEEMGKQAVADPTMAKRAAKIAEGVKNFRAPK
ncbi:MAG: hypothetical protein WCG63_02630 [Opitutaceae bacterium]